MKIKLFLALLLLTLSQHAYSQCDSITVQNVTNFTPIVFDSLVESDGLRNGPDYSGATLFYPLNGDNSLKSIVIVPGFLATQESVIGWARYLASRGFIGMTIGTNSVYNFPNIRANALIDGMETIRQENNRAGSPLFQRIDTSNIAVGGWSMGGGGAQLAAKIDPRIKAVIAFAPWLDVNTLVPEDLNHSSPVLILSGQIDPVAPPAQHADVHYNYTPNSTSKLLFEISGGDHNTALYPNTGNGDLGNVAFAWFKLHLDDNDCYCGMLSVDSLDQNLTASKYQTNLYCSTVSISDRFKTTLNLRAFPNPASNHIVAEFVAFKETEYVIYNTFGQSVKNGTINSGDIINIGSLPSGIYILKIGEEVVKIMKE